jgi:hypothetical protein
MSYIISSCCNIFCQYTETAFKFPLGPRINSRPTVDCPVAGKWLRLDNYVTLEFGHLTEDLLLRVQLTSFDVVSTETDKKCMSC